MSQQLRHNRRQERIAGKYRVKFVRRTLRFRETRVCKFVEYTGIWLIPDRRWGNNRQEVILRVKISEKGRITVSSWQALFLGKINLKVYTLFPSNMLELYFFFFLETKLETGKFYRKFFVYLPHVGQTVADCFLIPGLIINQVQVCLTNFATRSSRKRSVARRNFVFM